MPNKDAPTAKQGCLQKCGNVTIIYPFGVGEGCYRNPYFEIVCNASTSSGSEIPILQAYQLKVRNISYHDVTVVYDKKYPECYPNAEGMNITIRPLLGGRGRGLFNPLVFSPVDNKVVATGCGIFTYVTNGIYMNYTGGCLSLCDVNASYGIPKDSLYSKCLGYGCCEALMPRGLRALIIRVHAIGGAHTMNNSNSQCARAFVAGRNTPTERMSGDEVTMSMSWVFGKGPCKQEQGNNETSPDGCGDNACCINFRGNATHRCKCNKGYAGNPYLPDGCKDVDECKDSSVCAEIERAVCHNTEGSYFCRCPAGYHNNSATGNRCVSEGYANPQDHLEKTVLASIAAGLSMAAAVGSGIWCVVALKTKRKIKLRKMFFRRNGGLLLQQIASQEKSVVKTKIFTSEELEKATDNFNERRMLGKGGFGTVYKGMLSDGRIVAIKKSHVIHEKQIDQFINEVVILSEINHRNIVTLLGCCLETEVPLLVYEFISNGTLTQHLHEKADSTCYLPWYNRTRIAHEISEALAYLHSSASKPVFHRDVKSSNILLDSNYNAKISDFGIARSLPMEKTHLTTVLQGTFGYLDPEYFRSNQYTDKSDVYSFGVVLVELLAGERAVSRSSKVQVEEKSLVLNFVSAMKEGRMWDMIDSRIREEAAEEELLVFAMLARKCLKLMGRKRPTMKEVSTCLEHICKLSNNHSIKD
ncbi:hypothetical protein MLD38_022137 [Melastoma candidum]|uniref:Uncharacterized protein n=1 Tax=Melastoma candidum TaxID=119954 RepID=A0ACB9QI57_9MYRT|nr:hypothetical protein MLD38_022137 [Melastoma candidum]